MVESLAVLRGEDQVGSGRVGVVLSGGAALGKKLEKQVGTGCGENELI